MTDWNLCYNWTSYWAVTSWAAPWMLRCLTHVVSTSCCRTLMITASSHSEKAPFFTAGFRWFHHLQMQGMGLEGQQCQQHMRSRNCMQLHATASFELLLSVQPSAASECSCKRRAKSGAGTATLLSVQCRYWVAASSPEAAAFP